MLLPQLCSLFRHVKSEKLFKWPNLPFVILTLQVLLLNLRCLRGSISGGIVKEMHGSCEVIWSASLPQYQYTGYCGEPHFGITNTMIMASLQRFGKLSTLIGECFVEIVNVVCTDTALPLYKFIQYQVVW